MSDAIVIEGVTKRFRDKVAVQGLDLTVPEGSVYGFLGPNGAGKTTTIRMIMSIFYPDRGSIRVLGKESALESKDRIGYLPEERGVYRKMRVGEFLTYTARLKGVPAAGLSRTVSGWLERVALGDCLKKKCEELSKGMQQKVQFIASVIHEPDLIILDEPFSGLDPVNRRMLRTLIEEQRAAGRTVIFSTHAMFEAEQLCDSLFMINRGVKVLDAPLEEVWRTHDPRTILAEPLDATMKDASRVERAPGVGAVRTAARGFEVAIRDGADPAAVMRAILAETPMRSISLKKPNLEDIFLKLVGASSGDGVPEELRAAREAAGGSDEGVES